MSKEDNYKLKFKNHLHKYCVEISNIDKDSTNNLNIQLVQEVYSLIMES